MRMRAKDYVQPSDLDVWKKPGVRLGTGDEVAPEKRVAAARAAQRTKQEIRQFAELAKGNGAPAPSFERMSAAGARGGRAKREEPGSFRALRTEGNEGKPPVLPGYCAERCGQKAVINGYCRRHAVIFGEVA